MSRRNRIARKSELAAAEPSRGERAASIGWWIALAAALLAAFVVYAPALNGPFIFDDYHLPFSDPRAATAAPAFWIGGVRPVLMATYWANFLLTGTEPFSYHLVSLLLHVITSVLVFFVLRRLLELAEVKRNKDGLALFGAALFLLHPLQTESVAYIAGRSEIVAGLFYAAAWLVFLNNFASPTKIWTALEILLLTGAAVLGKESAISLPAVLFLTDLYWNPARLSAQLRSRLKLYVPIVLGGAFAAFFILRSLTGSTAAGFETKGVTPAIYALTQCRAILTYIGLFVLPFGQNADYAWPFFRSLSDHGAWIYALGMLALVAFIVWSRRRARLLSFGLLIFLVLLMPTSSIVPIRDAIAERRVYVPIVGLILASLWAFDRLGRRFRNAHVAIALVLLSAAALSYERSGVWGSGILLWRDAAIKNPANSRAHMGLGDAYLAAGQCARAIGEFQAVERLDGVTDEMVSNIAAAYQCNHQPDLALKELRPLAEKRPTAALYSQIGYLEGLSGHANDAMSAFDESVRLDPGYAQAYAYRGILNLTLDNRAKAAEDLEHALRLEPDNKTAAHGMSMLQEQR